MESENKILKFLKGFSLSETLIALAVIGVVFTISLGTVIAETNKHQTAVRLKKFYSILSSAFSVESSKSGKSSDWQIPSVFSEKSTYSVFEKYVKSNLMVMKDCKSSVEDDCSFDFKELDGSEKTLNSTWTRFFLNDGMFVAMQYVPDPYYKVIYFYVDTNGKKRLNVVGRDIFLLEYWIQNDYNPEYEGRLFTFGHEYSRDELISGDNEFACNKVSTGNYCSSLIMKDGWEIKNGYPWAQARYVVK